MSIMNLVCEGYLCNVVFPVFNCHGPAIDNTRMFSILPLLSDTTVFNDIKLVTTAQRTDNVISLQLKNIYFYVSTLST